MPRILLVEDEHDIADMLRMFFRLHGYAFYHAGDGEEALVLASEMLPHAILMDITLPDTDGFQLTVRLRGRPRTAHLPIIFATKWGGRDKRLAGLELGADDYVTKPYDVQELLLRVQNAISRAARTHYTDLRTGLPAAFMARPWIEAARRDPGRAIIEFTLEHAIPYREVYGGAANAAVAQMIGELLLDVVNRHGDLADFIGYLDDDNFLVITSAAQAQVIAAQVAAVFNDTTHRFYSDSDQAQGGLVIGGDWYPFMRLLCRITVGSERTELA